MQKINQPQALELNYISPTVTYDGQVTELKDGTNYPATISFFQLRPPKNGMAQADVVASINFPSITALKKFISDTQTAIKEHELKER